MLRKEYIVVILAVFLSFGLAGTVFAADNDMVRASDISSEAGNWQYHQVTTSPKHNYNEDSLSSVGTEAGNWQYNFDAPESKADIAASRYDYSSQSMSAVGTEAGADQFTFDNSERRTSRTLCSTC